MLPRYPGRLSATFSGTTFFPVGPRVVAKGDLLGFWASFGPRALREIQGPGRKHNFPELRALLGGKSVRPKSFSPKVRNVLTVCVLVDRTSRGRKSQKLVFQALLA